MFVDAALLNKYEARACTVYALDIKGRVTGCGGQGSHPINFMGGDLAGTGGRSSQNLRWGTAHASVPPIF